jgi:Flp pilus assembly pilin Flp
MSGFKPHTTFRSAASAVRLSGQRGQSLVETGLIVSLVAVVLVAALLAVSGQLSTLFNSVVTILNG